MTLDEVREEIKALKEDNYICAQILKDQTCSELDKAELMERIRENFNDLIYFKCILLLSEND